MSTPVDNVDKRRVANNTERQNMTALYNNSRLQVSCV